MPAITATAQDVWPPRVLVSVTGLTVGDAVMVYRVVEGTRTPVRAAADDSVADTSFLRTDAELPFGIPVSYIAIVNGSSEYTTSPVTYELPGGKVAVTDAISGESAEGVIFAWNEKAYDRQSSVFKVGNRNVVVSGDMGMFEGDIEFYTQSTSARDNLVEVFKSATESVVQVRQSGEYDGVDAYLAVLGMSERRFSQDGTDPRRIIAIRAAEVEGWAPALEARGFTLQDIADAYSGSVLLNANPYLETNAANWSSLGGTVARSTAQAHQGTASLLLTPDGTTGTVQARSENVPATAGQAYQASAWVRCSVARSINISLIWRDAGSSILSSLISPTIVLAANTWTYVEVIGEAPAGTAQAMLVPASMSSTPPVGHTIYIDEAKVEAIPSLRDIANDYATLLDLAEGDFS